MSRESRIMTASAEKVQTLINHYEAFGWELLSINGTQVTMSRETQNPVYTELVKHQAAYEGKMAEYQAMTPPTPPQKPAKVSLKTCFWLFILLIFPMVIYLTVKHKQNEAYKLGMAAYESALAEYNAKKEALLNEMEAIVLESRGIFFGRQN